MRGMKIRGEQIEARVGEAYIEAMLESSHTAEPLSIP